MFDQPLTAAELETRLDEPLDAVLSSRRTAASLACALAECSRAQQEFALKWVEIIAKTNAEMAYQFAAHVPEAFRLMDPALIEDWLIQAMDVYDRQGLYPGCAALNDVAAYATQAAAASRRVSLEKVENVLALFVQGLSGRVLRLAAADEAYTDTETLFLPARIGRFPARADNFRLYKATAVHLWAQTRFGTFRAALQGRPLSEALARFPDPARALTLFHALETIRLDACIARELPGLHRDLLELRQLAQEPPWPADWRDIARLLTAPDAAVEDTLAALAALYPAAPAPRCYQGRLFPERAEQAIQARLAREQDAFRQALARLRDERRTRRPDGPEQAAAAADRFSLRRTPHPGRPEPASFELLLNGQPLAPAPDVRALMDSIVQDLGQIPEDYLVAAGDGGYRREGAPEKRPEDVWKGTYHEEGAFLYNEWDYRRRHYRKDWCVLREIDVHPESAPFVVRTLKKYTGVLTGLRKTFEALRGEDRLLKRQNDGDHVDFDALVEAQADLRRGRELSERLFSKRHKLERDIAVLFMVDMSGSTKGWINDAEREALVLLCEALEILGDAYAIYGFSGMTRKRCELYRVKRFDEPYRDEVKARIAGMRPQDYTRMGVTIRHLTKLLGQVEARTKLLITLSDGKPDDYDGYRGDYGIEDTRQALIEAKRAGIHPFCITIDTEARDYLPHMYGAVNWTLVDDVRKLPLRVSEIYRRLTL